MSIQKASSLTTFSLHYEQTRCKQQYLQLKDILPITRPAASIPGWKLGRCAASFTYSVLHILYVVLELSRKSWALLPTTRCFPSTSPKKTYQHNPGEAQSVQGGGLIPFCGSWPRQLVCAFSYCCACPQNDHPFSEPGWARGSEMFPGKEHWGNFVWGPHPGLRL